jgi:hypothetical protein
MVARVAAFAPFRLRVPIDIDAGCVPKNQVQLLGKKIPVPQKESPLRLFPDLGQKAVGPVKMLQGDPRKLFDGLQPLASLKVGAQRAEPL